MTTIEAYVPTLLNFRENSLVYSPEDLSRLERRVLSQENGITQGSRANEFRHELSPDCLRQSLAAAGGDKEVAGLVTRVEVYYYHHRIILKYVFSAALPAAWERRTRRLILAHSKHVLTTMFVAAINTAGAHGGPLPDDHGRVTSYYSYCLLLLPLDRKFERDIENFLGSHTFRIVEVTPKLLERDRVHIVRISIPSINLYSPTRWLRRNRSRTIKRAFRIDILNAIYQHMLYAKKEEDANSLHDLTDFSSRELDNRNVMREAQLHALWNHAVDALGGRMVDLQGVHQQTLLFRASILALLLALAGIITTVVLAVR